MTIDFLQRFISEKVNFMNKKFTFLLTFSEDFFFPGKIDKFSNHLNMNKTCNIEKICRHSVKGEIVTYFYADDTSIAIRVNDEMIMYLDEDKNPILGWKEIESQNEKELYDKSKTLLDSMTLPFCLIE